MQYTIPHYYKQFRCIADKCPDTCCAGWQIMIDNRSLKKYSKVKGGFGNRLQNGIDWKAHAFLQQGGRCEFLNEDNLCDIYKECGANMLCRTCRNYPRHTEEFEGLARNFPFPVLSGSCQNHSGEKKNLFVFLQRKIPAKKLMNILISSFLLNCLIRES